jgi:hypothetical protein
MTDEFVKDRAWAEQEITRILDESNCKLTIEEVAHDGRLVRRSVIVVPKDEK